MNAPLRCGSLLRLRCPCRSVLRRRVERLPQCALEALLHAGFVLNFDRLGRRRCGSLHDPTAYGYFDVGNNRILSPFDRLGLRGGLPDGHRNHARPCGYCPAKRHPERTLRSAPRNKPRFPPGAHAQRVWSDYRSAAPSTVPGEFQSGRAYGRIGGISPKGRLVPAPCKAICRLFGRSAALPEPSR
jgi:hypothetical protein